MRHFVVGSMLAALSLSAAAQERLGNIVSDLEGHDGDTPIPLGRVVSDEGPFISSLDPRSRAVRVVRDSTVLTSAVDPASPPLVRLGKGLTGEGIRSGPGRVQARFSISGWVCVEEAKGGVTRELLPGWRKGARTIGGGWHHLRAAPGRDQAIVASLPRGATIELEAPEAKPAPTTKPAGGGWGSFDAGQDTVAAPDLDDGFRTTREGGVLRTWVQVRLELTGHAPLADLSAAPLVRDE